MQTEMEILRAKVVELTKENVDLRVKLDELFETRDTLEKDLARVGGVSDEKKEALLLKVIKAHPDCYTQAEMDEAFPEAVKKAGY